MIAATKKGVHCFDIPTGDMEWSYRTAGEINDFDGGVKAINGLAWAFDDAGHLSVIDIGTGTVLYDKQQKKLSDNPSDMIVLGDKLYMSLADLENTPPTGIPKGTSALSISENY